MVRENAHSRMVQPQHLLSNIVLVVAQETKIGGRIN
jgi:hypothetical protein